MYNVFRDLDHCRREQRSYGEKWGLLQRKMSENDVRWLSQVVCDPENTLQHLDLHGCGIGDEKLLKGGYFAMCLEKSFQKTMPLLILNLDHNGLGDDGAVLIATACKKHPALTELHLSDNHIGKQGLRALAEMLCQNGVLLHLYLDRNGFGSADAPLLAHALTVNCTLQRLSVTGNSLGRSIPLRDAIRISIGLVEFHWEAEELGKLSTRRLARDANPPPPDLPFPDDPVETIPASSVPHAKANDTPPVAPLTASTIQNTPSFGFNTLAPVVVLPPAPITPIKIKVSYATLHDAVCDLDAVKEMMSLGADPAKKDRRGYTPLMCAAEKGMVAVVEYLAPLSPWHTEGLGTAQGQGMVGMYGQQQPGQYRGQATNAAKFMFIDIALNGRFPDLAAVVSPMVDQAIFDENAMPSHRWAAMKYSEKVTCTAIDDLMDITGLRSVKNEALKLFSTVRADLERPPESRRSNKDAMNFLFLGNPGSGKTTVARIFGEILSSLGVRKKGAFVETSGQKLLNKGSAAFPKFLADATPGVLFIDEVYQLDATSNPEGRAITNDLLGATEDDRDQLTVIVAGYKDDVKKKWMASNDGIPSRFPLEITFEDYDENELHSIFLGMVAKANWQIEPYTNDNGQLVDVALVAARRLSRGANNKGFGNARSVRAMIERAMREASSRQLLEKRVADRGGNKLSPNYSTTMTLPDVLGAPIDPSSHPLIKKLLAMIGLDDVKSSVLGLLEMAKQNYLSELRGEVVLEIAMHRVFLGNPGTGKTTIAKLYGQILYIMGYLSNGDVELVGASKLMGDAVGATPKKVNEFIDSLKGKVGIIDEAYVLGRKDSIYGREVLDTLVERVQGVQDFAVILCGYEEDMKAMFRDGNQGLARRFKMEDAFHFADYNDAQLTAILLERAKNSGLHVTEQLASDAVFNVLAKERAKPNFGNAGLIDNLLERGQQRMMKRNENDRRKIDGRWVLVADDLFEAPVPGSAFLALEKLRNADHILQHIRDLEKLIKVAKKDPVERKNLLQPYVFVGPPGTGKTTVARAFGEVFWKLGLISSNSVVECKAKELLGKYQGHTVPLVNAKMDSALGGVFFIDEAYGLLARYGDLYAEEATGQLLANMTEPKYEGNMIIIFAGYKDHIDEFLSANPGLPGRIKETLEFYEWTANDCLQLVLETCKEKSIDVPIALHPLIENGFTELSGRKGWSNARDVEAILKKMKGSRALRCDDDGNIEGGFTEEDVNKAFEALYRLRRPKAETAEMAPQLPNWSSFFSHLAPPLPLEMMTEHHQQQKQQQQQSQQQQQQKQQSQRQQEQERREELQLEQKVQELADPSDDDLKFALDKALQELRYDIYRIRDILHSQILPPELVELVASKLNRPPDSRVTRMLVAQCPTLLPGVEQLIADIEREQERQRQEQEKQRLIQEEIARANEAEKQRLLEVEKRRLEAERRRQAQTVMERVRMIGRCPMSYEWIKVAGGYRCTAGGHFVSDSEVNYL